MEIYINDEKTNYELENEKNSFDIINAISEFAAKSNPQHYVTNIIIDNKEYSYADTETLQKIKIDDIKKMKVETGDLFNITSLSINQISKFIQILKDVFIKMEWDPMLVKIEDSLEWMNHGIKQIIDIFDSKSKYIGEEKEIFFKNTQQLIELIKGLNENNFLSNNNLVSKIMGIIDSMQSVIFRIKKWLVYSYRLPDKDFIFDNINRLIESIDSITPKLENIPILFQTGDDREAMNIIKSLTDILEESIGLFVFFKESLKLHMDKFTVTEVSFDSFFNTVTGHLKELMEAIQHNDSVMISDLLEYEFIPNIEEIKKMLLKIREEAFTKVN